MKWLSAIAVMAWLALAPAAQAETIDPNKILFSLPTISKDSADVEPMAGAPAEGDIVLHEDDWSQFEFYPKDRLAEIQRVMTEYKAFEAANRVGTGWKNTYVRKIDRKPVIKGADAIAHLEKALALKAGPAPVIEGAGRVKGGFTFAFGGKPILYGAATNSGIPMLGGLLRQGADPQLAIIFYKLNASDGLFLVDWRSQVILVSVGPDGTIEKWKP